MASALAGVITTAAVGAFAALNRNLTRTEMESRVSDDSKTLVDLLVSELQGVGGGPVRPWMALYVEDGGSAAFNARAGNFGQTGGQRSDRVTFATLIPTKQCTIQTFTGSGNTGTVTTEGSNTTCCLKQLASAARLNDAETAIHLYAIVGQQWRQISIENIDVAACKAEWNAGPLSAIDAPPAAPSDFIDGALAPVSIVTIYHVEATNELMVFRDQADFRGMDVSVDPTTETRRIASDIFDFQVQLAYDTEPDGRIRDDTSTTDEWLYNVPNETTAFDIEDLRMVGIGAVVGIKVTDPTYTSTAQVLGGPVITRERFHIRGAMGRAALRNVFVFF